MLGDWLDFKKEVGRIFTCLYGVRHAFFVFFENKEFSDSLLKKEAKQIFFKINEGNKEFSPLSPRKRFIYNRGNFNTQVAWKK